MSKSNPPGATGIGAIVAGTVGVSVIITLVTGSFVHWPFIVGGLASGLLAAKSVR
jgi:hypothetical protein